MENKRNIKTRLLGIEEKIILHNKDNINNVITLQF